MMQRFCAQRIIHGKLAGTDGEHRVVAHSTDWPAASGVPKSVGTPVASNFEGACSLDWHAVGTTHWLALSWCENGPRITNRAFFQAHHVMARPEEFAPVLPLLPTMVARMREIPIFSVVETALPPFVFDYEAEAFTHGVDEAWFQRHWHNLATVLVALFHSGSICIRSNFTVEAKTQIIAALMMILPPHLRSQLTFSTDEFARRPYWRRLTFSPNHCATMTLTWPDSPSDLDPPTHSAHPLVTRFGRIFASDGLAAVAAEANHVEYRSLAFAAPRALPRLFRTHRAR
jgi:hypothetical protein